MSDKIAFLITIFSGNQLMRVALQCDGNSVHDDVLLYPMEPESIRALQAMLPDHISSIGPIVEVEQICDVVVK